MVSHMNLVYDCSPLETPSSSVVEQPTATCFKVIRLIPVGLKIFPWTFLDMLNNFVYLCITLLYF